MSRRRNHVMSVCSGARSCMILLSAVLLVLALALAPGGGAEVRAGEDRRIERAIEMQRNVKSRYHELIQAMHQVARDLEATDPQTAAAIASAAERAETALIADDMDRVIELLQSGLVVPADATQARVVQHLREVLETLRRGGSDLTTRLFQIENLQDQLEALRDVLARQRRLEARSRIVAFGDADEARAREALTAIDRLAAKQAAVLEKTEALSLDAMGRRLANAGRALFALQSGHGTLQRAMADAYPSPDRMAANIVALRSLRQQAIRSRVELRALAADEQVRAALSGEAAAAALAGPQAMPETVDRVIEELTNAITALEADHLREAQVAYAEAGTLIGDAIASQRSAMGGLGGSRAMIEAMTLQRALIEPATEAVRLAAAMPQLEPQASGRPSGPDDDDETMQARTRALTAAVEAAAEALGQYDAEAAIGHQHRMARSLTLARQGVEAAAQRIAALRREPAWSEQGEAQQWIAAALDDIVRATVADEPDIAALANEVRLELRRARDHAALAAEHLGQQDAGRANAQQREVIAILELAIDTLETGLFKVVPMLIEELRMQWLGILEHAMVVQSQASEYTLDIWERRADDGSFARPELIRLMATANVQAQVGVRIEEMVYIMSISMSSNRLITFPPVVPLLLELVEADIKAAEARLRDRDPGPRTQRIQTDIEERLAAMHRAMAGDDGDDTVPPPDWADNSFGSVDVSNRGRIAELRMLMDMQAQINRRTEELDALRREGPLDEAAGADYRRLVHLQSEVARFIYFLARDIELRWRPQDPPRPDTLDMHAGDDRRSEP